MNLFPVFLKLAGRPVLVVGAGRVGEPKIEGLLHAEAAVHVVAPVATFRVAAWARARQIAWQQRDFKSADLANMSLVIAATPSAELNHRVIEEARARGILCNAVDDPEYCDFYAPAVVQRGPLQIAISTAGQSPALAQRLRQELEQQYGPEYERWVEELGQRRQEFFRNEGDPERRKELLHQLASREAFESRTKQSHPLGSQS
jgi:precorrin-2 dehydrogenase/sirohydrochlorin ferrochelatase